MAEKRLSPEEIKARLMQLNEGKKAKASTKGRSARQDLKLLYIRDYLHRHTNKENPKSANDIIAYLDTKNIQAERKTIYHDIDRLKSEFKEPIEYNKKKHGYYIAQPIFSLYELQILTDCVRASEFLSSEEVSSITKRIAELTNIYDYKKLTTNASWLCEPSARPMNSELYNVDIIKRAIEQNNKISFRLFQYFPTVDNRASNGKEYVTSYTGNETFIVSPRALIRDNKKYLLLIYCSDSRIKEFEDCVFEVGHMEDVTILPSERECFDLAQPYIVDVEEIDYSEKADRLLGKTAPDTDKKAWTEEDYRDMLNYMREEMNTAWEQDFDILFGDDEVYTIELTFKGDYAIDVLKKFGYDTILVPTVAPYSKAIIQMRLRRDFFNWLFSTHGTVLVTSPENIKHAYFAYVSEILRRHERWEMSNEELVREYFRFLSLRTQDKELYDTLIEKYTIREVDDSNG